MQKETIVTSFEAVASILVVMAIAAVTFSMILETDAGRFSVWPFAAFTIFISVILWAYGLISKDT